MRQTRGGQGESGVGDVGRTKFCSGSGGLSFFPPEMTLQDNLKPHYYAGSAVTFRSLWPESRRTFCSVSEFNGQTLHPLAPEEGVSGPRRGIRSRDKGTYLAAVLYHPLDHAAVAPVGGPVQSRAAPQVSGLPRSAVSSEVLHNFQVSRVAGQHQAATDGEGAFGRETGRQALDGISPHLAQSSGTNPRFSHSCEVYVCPATGD